MKTNIRGIVLIHFAKFNLEKGLRVLYQLLLLLVSKTNLVQIEQEQEKVQK